MVGVCFAGCVHGTGCMHGRVVHGRGMCAWGEGVVYLRACAGGIHGGGKHVECKRAAYILLECFLASF